MLKLLQRITHSRFLRHIVTVSGGQMVAAAIPILAAPVLGRLYRPEDYGPMASYMSFASVLGSIATWQYSQAIIVEKREASARVLVQLCLLASLLTALLAVPFALWLAASARNVSGVWFLLLPFSVFITGIASSLAALANRWQLYHRTAFIQWIPAALSVSVSITLGWKGFAAEGLLWAYFISQLLALILGFWVVCPRFVSPLRSWSWARVRALACKHRRFATYTAPTGFISSATLNAPVFALTSLHQPESVGLFSRANQLLSMPLGLIGGAVAQVFQRRAAQDIHATGHCRPLFLKTAALLLGAGAIPTLLLVILAPTLFGWFLGPNWVEAGQVARWLAPMLLLRVVGSPLSTVFYIRGAQRLDSALSISGCLLIWGSVVMAANQIGTAKAVIIAYSIGYSIIYIPYILLGFRISGMAKEFPQNASASV